MVRNLTNNGDPLVKIDNMPAWDGVCAPFFEAYTLTLWDPHQAQWGLWLEHAVCAREHKDGHVASLSGVFVSRQGEIISLASDFDLRKHDIVHADKFITLPTAQLTLAEAVGAVQNARQCLRWELCFEDPSLSLRLKQHNPLYQVFFPDTKWLSPRVLGFATGAVYADGFKKEVFRARIHQGHSYGRRLPHSSVWALCNHFQEDAAAFFEMHSHGRFVNFGICFDDMIFVSSLSDTVFFNQLKMQNGQWHFSFKKSPFKFTGTITPDAKLTAQLSPCSPTAKARQVSVCPLATIAITIHKREKNGWELYKTLTSQRCSVKTETVSL